MNVDLAGDLPPKYDRAAWARILENLEIAFVQIGERYAPFGNLYTSGYMEGSEITAPAAPSANNFRLYAEDDGAGHTRLVTRFATGSKQILATEGLNQAELVPYVDISKPPYNCVPGQNCRASIQQALDDIAALGGGTLWVPWPNGNPFLIDHSGGEGLAISSNVRILGGGSPGTASSTVQHFSFNGTGACIYNKEGHADTGITRECHIENLGILLTAAGASTSALACGIRFWRTRFCTITNYSCRIAANNCAAIHWKCERSGGTYQGNFDGTYIHLRSQNSGSRTGCKHFHSTGTHNDGQWNTNTILDARVINEGRAFDFGPGLGNTLIALTGEGQGSTDRIISCNDYFTQSMFMQVYMERTGTPSVKDIFMDTNSENLTFYGVVFGSNTNITQCTLRAESTLYDYQDWYRGAGASDPWPQYTENGPVTRTKDLAAATTFTPNLNNGLLQYTAIPNATTALTINNPTGRLSGVTLNLDFLLNNSSNASAITSITWGSQFQTSVTGITASKKVIVPFIFDVVNTKWVQRGAVQEL